MKELSKFFRVMVQHKHTAWPSYIEIIQNIINKVYQETTGFTPMEIHLGKNQRDFGKSVFQVVTRSTIYLTMKNYFLLRAKSNQKE